MPTVQHRTRSSLPQTNLAWLSLHDHFVATVGPMAGSGAPLGPVLVLADATFAPHSRFPLHPHEDMEILSIVIDGRLSHHGDQANGATLEARSAQLISARDGIVHAEGNDTDTPTRMLQLWFRPETRGGAPAYFGRSFPERGRHVVAGDDVLPLRTDVKVWWVDVAPGKKEHVVVAPGRRAYVMALDGGVAVSSENRPVASLAKGDGLQVDDGTIELSVETACSVLWIDAKR